MRIISGKNKGKKLLEFKGRDIRPTSDRAKESLFNILGDRVLDCDFLDLCSGTGSIGIEAYSRGANSVTFVDNDKESIKLTQKNANSIGLDKDFCLSDAISFVKRTNDSFDIIFFDPPYAFNGIKDVLVEVKNRKLLKDGGIFVYEHKSDQQSVSVLGFEIYDSRKYGIAVFDFYKESL